MQGSLFPESELHGLSFNLKVDELRRTNTAQLIATSRSGAILASAGLVCTSLATLELLPILAAESVTGWLYGGAHEAVTLPVRAFRARRHSLSAPR